MGWLHGYSMTFSSVNDEKYTNKKDSTSMRPLKGATVCVLPCGIGGVRFVQEIDLW